MTAAPPAPAPGPAATDAQVTTVNIYVAAKPIPVGSTITADMLAVQPWPEHLVLPGFITADAQSQSIADKAMGDDKSKGGSNPAQTVIGDVARGSFQQNEPILTSKLANPNDPNFLAAALPKGMRIISIMVNETEGVAGFVFPGDHVDVILTHDVDREKVSEQTVVKGGDSSGSETTIQKVPYKEPISETLINNVTVVAVDQRASGSDAVDKDGHLVIPKSVSLMVSQVDAQRIRLGQKIGTLTLSLRSLNDRDSADPATIIGSENVSQYKMPAPQPTGGEGGNGVVVYRGAPHDNAQGSQNSGGGSGASLATHPLPMPTVGNGASNPTPAGQR